ncbi:MAG TPA: type II secretion system F family protein [Phycisphaerales bacterium]|nr:type II secretion system F family protein [Phycisphaerales bacterium]
MSVRTYSYTALDAAGQKTSGTVRAIGEQEAFRKVNAAGLTPLKLDALQARAPLFTFGTITHSDIVSLTRELAVLVEARIPLDRGLASIAEHERKHQLADMIRDVATMIESGQSLTAALAKYRHVFGDAYIETMRAAEKSGSLVEVTTHVADMLERQQETRQLIRRAMAYPVVVCCMVLAAVTVIVGFVVPKFAATFSSQGAKLPLATRIVQSIGESGKNYWWAYAGGLAAIIVTLVLMWRNPAGRCRLELLLTRIPYVGKIVISVAAARFARVLGIGLASGLDVIEAIDVAGRSTARPVFVAECSEMVSRLRQGDRLTDVIQKSRYLPPFAKRMIGAGKDSRELARACDIVARHFDRQSSTLTKNINTIIEPLLTIALAGIVLLVALSVFLPMWQMSRLKH